VSLNAREQEDQTSDKEKRTLKAISRAMKSVEYTANVGVLAVPESPSLWSAHSIDVWCSPSPSSRMKLLF
jgi:hypothetical protein